MQNVGLPQASTMSGFCCLFVEGARKAWIVLIRRTHLSRGPWGCSLSSAHTFGLSSSPHVKVELVLQQEPPQLLKATLAPGFSHILSPVFYQAGLVSRVGAPPPISRVPTPQLVPRSVPRPSRRPVQAQQTPPAPLLLESGPVSSSAAGLLWFLSYFSVGNS